MKRSCLTYLVFIFTLFSCTEKFDDTLATNPTLVPRYLHVSPSELSYSASPGSNSLYITSTETPWKVDNGIVWISISPESGNATTNVSVSVLENKSGDDSRLGIFYVNDDVDDWKFQQTVTVIQQGATPSITLSKNSISFSGSENSETVTVSSNCTWSVETSTVDWLTVNKKDNVIELSVTSNQTNTYRNASVLVYHSGNRYTYESISVYQLPASINASTDTLVFNNKASSVDITVTSESEWTASASTSWIEVSPSSGNSGTSTLKVSVSPNTSTNERKGYVALSIGGNQRIQIPIRQRGIYVEATQSSLSFEAAGGSSDLSILSNTTWTVTTNNSWITVSPDNGNGDGKIKVTVQDNPNTATRSGEIHITQSGLDIDFKVSVTQSGKTFDVKTTVLNFDDKEETQTVNVETDGTWAAFTNNDWISLSPLSASGNSTLSITVSENPNNDERSGQVVITMGDKTAKISIIQKGKYFTVSNSMLSYNSKGGSIGISISTNDSWTAKIVDNQTWLKLSDSSGSGNIEVSVTASDNPSVNSRTATIVFETAHNQSVRVIVSQDARYLKVDNSEVLFYSKGGTTEPITITTDGTYNIICSDTWFTVSQTNNTFKVTASENTTTDARIGTITISLTDLKEGSYSLKISVTQLNYGGSFIRNDYDKDIDYDSMGTSSGSLTITGFGPDSNYDSFITSGTTLSVSNYKSDANWDNNVSSGLTVTVTGFKSDNNLDTSTSSSGTITKTGFEDDNNWK